MKEFAFRSEWTADLVRALLLTTLSSFIAIAFSSCQTGPMQEATPVAGGVAPSILSDYRQIIETYSDGESEYVGFYNNFQYKATILNSKIRRAMLTKKAEYYQWTTEKLETEIAEARNQMAEQTRVFMSFYTPDRTSDNLADEKSIWRVYLEVGGRRYQGKVEKVKTLLPELVALIPYHTRFASPYEVVFPIPTSSIEDQSIAMTVTGPLGTEAVRFQPVN